MEIKKIFKRSNIQLTVIRENRWWIMIAYSEQCQICDLLRRFSFGMRGQAWSLKSFCVAEFY